MQKSHPREVLLGAAITESIPVCDHYCGVEARMIKSLALQAEFIQEFGACVFDVTLDCEDGAPVGNEKQHAQMISEIACDAFDKSMGLPHLFSAARVAVRVHSVDHPSFEQDVEIMLAKAGHALCHVMVPKVDSREEVDKALQAIDRATARSSRSKPLPIHVLIESPVAVNRVSEIVSHPRVQSASFGLMDFVSAHGGGIPASAMGLANDVSGAGQLDQFAHPLVVRAKLEVSAACHAFGKVASHCVVTEFKNTSMVTSAAERASKHLGYGRMWSIHPDQIRPIVEAFTPTDQDVAQASEIICKAYVANWAPISVSGVLHDRASYRYYWQVLCRAQQTGRVKQADGAAVFF